MIQNNDWGCCDGCFQVLEGSFFVSQQFKLCVDYGELPQWFARPGESTDVPE